MLYRYGAFTCSRGVPSTGTARAAPTLAGAVLESLDQVACGCRLAGTEFTGWGEWSTKFMYGALTSLTGVLASAGTARAAPTLAAAVLESPPWGGG